MCQLAASFFTTFCFTPTLAMALVSVSFAIVLSLILLFFILRQTREKKTGHYLLSTYVVGSLAISLVGLLVISSPSPESTLLYSRLFSIPITIGNLSFYWFIQDYLGKKKKWWTGLSLVYLAVFACLNILYPELILAGAVWDASLGWFDIVFNEQTAWIAFVQFLFVFHGLGQLVQAHARTKSPREKNRLRYLLMAVLALTTGVASLYFPQTRLVNPDSLGTVISASLLTYAILKFKLLDIAVVVRKGLIYTVLTSLVTGIYLLIAFVFQSLFGIVYELTSFPTVISTAMFVAVVFQPLQNTTQKVIDKIFFRRAYDPEQLLADFSRNVSTSIEIGRIATLLTNTFTDTLQIAHAQLLLYEENTNNSLQKEVKTKFYRKISSIELTEIRQAVEENSEIVDVFSADEKLRAIFLKHRISLLIPLVSEKGLMGVILLSAKKSEQAYFLDEYRLFGTIANQAAVAINNALLYDKVKRQKAKVDAALRKERELESLKSEFIAIASHNLRTPLTIATGNLDNLLGKSRVKSRQHQESLENIAVALNELSMLTEQLLEISSTTGKVSPGVREPGDLVEYAREVVESFRLAAARKKLRLVYIKPPFKVPTLELNHRRIKIAISNLVDNAIKFTEKGEVKLFFVKKEGKIIVSVSDTGVGIPKSEQSKIFTKFHQAKTDVYTYRKGVGIGLYIVKMIVTAHKGKVWFTSGEGKGSTFSISLPIS